MTTKQVKKASRRGKKAVGASGQDSSGGSVASSLKAVVKICRKCVVYTCPQRKVPEWKVSVLPSDCPYAMEHAVLADGSPYSGFGRPEFKAGDSVSFWDFASWGGRCGPDIHGSVLHVVAPGTRPAAEFGTWKESLSGHAEWSYVVKFAKSGQVHWTRESQLHPYVDGSSDFKVGDLVWADSWGHDKFLGEVAEVVRAGKIPALIPGTGRPVQKEWSYVVEQDDGQFWWAWDGEAYRPSQTELAEYRKRRDEKEKAVASCATKGKGAKCPLEGMCQGKETFTLVEVVQAVMQSALSLKTKEGKV